MISCVFQLTTQGCGSSVNCFYGTSCTSNVDCDYLIKFKYDAASKSVYFEIGGKHDWVAFGLRDMPALLMVMSSFLLPLRESLCHPDFIFTLNPNALSFLICYTSCMRTAFRLHARKLSGTKLDRLSDTFFVPASKAEHCCIIKGQKLLWYRVKRYDLDKSL